MSKTEYGVPVPRGVRKDWEAKNSSPSAAAAYLRGFGVPLGWDQPSICVAWYDRFRRCRACVGHYPNGRSALVRIDANGVWKTTFGEVK